MVFGINALLLFLIILHPFKDLVNDDVYIIQVVLQRQRAPRGLYTN